MFVISLSLHLDGVEIPVHVTTYPLNSSHSNVEEKQHHELHTDPNKTAKQKHREELELKTHQLMESYSRNSRRHSAKKQDLAVRFYEVISLVFTL